MISKRYSGDRTIDGCLVTVDEQALDPAFSVESISDDGFEWSYEGVGPAQLALALLYDHFGDEKLARKHQDLFMRRVVANFNNEWEMTSEDIDTALSNIGATS
jgi:Family of unknown function (DUF6166)